MPDDQTLLSCPFCGGECRIIPDAGNKRRPNILYRPQCDRCGANLGGFDQTDFALVAWNRRDPAVIVAAQTWHHLARRTLYIEHCRAELQAGAPVTEGAVLVVYRGEDGKFWAREVSEFEDGRFEAVKP